MTRIRDRVSLRGDKEMWHWPSWDRNCFIYMQAHSDVPDVLAKYVKDKKVVVQAGGNCGYYIKRYAELFERVYTFEPDPLNFYSLVLNCDTNNVIKFQGCVGNTRGVVELNYMEGECGGTHVQGSSSGMYPTFMIDDLGLDRCDLIQLDTEGYELFGLMGAEDTIKKYKPVICIEWYEPWAARYGVNLQKMEEYLTELGYSFVADHDSDRVYVPNE